MGQLVAFLDDQNIGEGDGFGWGGVLFFLLESEEVGAGYDAPPSACCQCYRRQVLRIRDSFSRKPSNCTPLISSLNSFSLIAINYNYMGNKTCCCDEWTGGQFKPDRPLPSTLNFTTASQGTSAKPALPSKEEHYKDYKVQKEKQESKKSISKEELKEAKMPQLSPAVKSILAAQKFPLESEWTLKPSHKRYQLDEYWGKLDESGRYPHGQGRLFKADGSLYIGDFHMGKAHGKGIFIFPDNTYYHGQFSANHAEGKGVYRGNNLEYIGGFHNNHFQGEGKEKGPTYTFTGQYEKGIKKQGLLIWTLGGEQYEYFGPFVAGRFEGKGTLKEPNGTYRGDFAKGEKHGKGVYEFKNRLRYEGEYKQGVRSGRGTIFNLDHSIAYQGEFDNGLPHGEGNIPGQNGNKIAGRWVEGIDEDLL